MVLIKAMDGSFRAATEADQEQSSKWKVGRAVKFKAAQQSDRSLKHHKMYFGGLLRLAFDYWEPAGGLITDSEHATLTAFTSFLGRIGGDEYALAHAQNEFLKQVGNARASRIESPVKTLEALHDWVKVEAGFYTVEQTPKGIKKTAQSINFNAMDKEQFEHFYKEAFSVCWRFILSRTFKNQNEADNAINQLINLG